MEILTIISTNEHPLDECQHVKSTIVEICLTRYDKLIVWQRIGVDIDSTIRIVVLVFQLLPQIS